MSRADEEEPIISKQQQHLYLILDDWAYGYSFRKLDLSSHAPALIPEGIERGAATSLPPPFFCLEAQPGWPMYFTASGSKIWGMPPKEEGTIHDSGGVCYDVHAENFSFVPRHTDQPRPVYFPIGNKLFSLGRLSLQSLDIGTKEHPIGVALSWSNLINVPVDSINVISHAVFPDGRTIFVSTGFMAVPYTYSFHLSEDGSLNMWNPQGDWILPFHGSGYFDSKLNTWIGLSLYQEKPGHICSCDLTSATSQHPPVVKYTKDHLFTMDPDERHVGANLVYMGHRSKFCLVECIINNSYEEPRNTEEENTDQEDTDDYMLRLTTFSLDYDGNGDLMTGRRRVQYYQMPKHVSRRACQHPAAFWM